MEILARNPQCLSVVAKKPSKVWASELRTLILNFLRLSCPLPLPSCACGNAKHRTLLQETEHDSDAAFAMSCTAVTEGQLPWILGDAPGTFWLMAEASSFITSRDVMETLVPDNFMGLAEASPSLLPVALVFSQAAQISLTTLRGQGSDQVLASPIPMLLEELKFICLWADNISGPRARGYKASCFFSGRPEIIFPSLHKHHMSRRTQAVCAVLADKVASRCYNSFNLEE
ncbi:hypothetical protein DUI87_07426 [Hirundo rustica rustica]|uniref:Uncharacterized protein n=1 Tax=Hirundo rustica rustica TaxID=333673 RepID=A0A3M0KRH5_HIRRU|nr:hypothetical protein DUI87_07426 [Hirundo rustica rustica]